MSLNEINYKPGLWIMTGGWSLRSKDNDEGYLLIEPGSMKALRENCHQLCMEIKKVKTQVLGGFCDTTHKINTIILILVNAI